MVSVSDGETLIGHPYSEAPSPESAEERASPGDDERVLRFKNYVESQLKILALKKEYIITLVRTKKAYRQEIEARDDLDAEEKERLLTDLECWMKRLEGEILEMH